MANHESLNLIGEHFVASADGKTFEHVNPHTAQVDGHVADSGLLDVVMSVQAANKAWTKWQKATDLERAAHLLAIADLIEKNSDELALAQALDIGTPIRFARTISVARAVQEFRFHARLISDAKGESVILDKSLYLTNRLPIGVVAAILPWSDPVWAMASRLAPALAAGNVMIAKASEFAPRTTSLLARLILESGLPTGVFNLLQGRGVSVGDALVQHPGLSTIAFMGSTSTGQLIARGSAEHLKRTHLALSAKNPVIVFAGIDIEKTAHSVAMVISGAHPSTCLRGSRLFIQETIYTEFLTALKTAIDKLVIGDPTLETTELGPLAHVGLKEKYNIAVGLAASERGKPLIDSASGTELAGYYVKPAVMYDLTLCSTLQQEEVIGPFVTASSFKYQLDAVKQANTNPFGLAAYIFDTNASRVGKVASKIEAGRVFVNAAAPLFDHRIEHGGLKHSGQGREGSSALFTFFSRSTTIAQDLS